MLIGYVVMNIAADNGKDLVRLPVHLPNIDILPKTNQVVLDRAMCSR